MVINEYGDFVSIYTNYGTIPHRVVGVIIPRDDGKIQNSEYVVESVIDAIVAMPDVNGREMEVSNIG